MDIFLQYVKFTKVLYGQIIEQLTKYISTFWLLNILNSNSINDVCYSLILGDVISEVVSLVFLFFEYHLDIKNYSNIATTKRVSHNLNKRIFTLSLPIALTSYIRSGLSSIKQILIPKGLEKSGLNSYASLSCYGIILGKAMPIIAFPAIFLSAFSSLLIPEFSRYFIKKDYKRIKQVASFILLVTIIVSTLIFFILIIYSDFFSLTFYKNLEASFYIKVLSPLVVFMYSDSIIDSILKGMNAQSSVMFINIIDLIISLIIICFVVPILGINGYIISLYVSEILNFICSLAILIKKTKIS